MSENKTLAFKGNLQGRLHLITSQRKKGPSIRCCCYGIKFRSHTSLWGRRKEPDLDLFLAQFIGKFDHRVPGAWSDGLAKLVEVIDQMNLARLVDGDLVAGPDAQTGVVVGTIVHETFASSRISLLIKRAWNRQPGIDACLDIVLI